MVRSCLNCENPPFPVDRRVTKSNIETTPAQGIANSPLLIRAEDHERNSLCANGSELWNAQLPNAEDLKKQSLEFVIDVIDLVNKQNARLLFVEERTKQRPFREKL